MENIAIINIFGFSVQRRLTKNGAVYHFLNPVTIPDTTESKGVCVSMEIILPENRDSNLWDLLFDQDTFFVQVLKQLKIARVNAGCFHDAVHMSYHFSEDLNEILKEGGAIESLSVEFTLESTVEGFETNPIIVQGISTLNIIKEMIVEVEEVS